jgi:glycosyltransferase involved in cell wall biosynthesis
MGEGGGDALRSRTWDGPTPRVAVVVPTYRRPRYLPELLACLEAQDLPAPSFEVVVVDDASGDETWAVLSELVATTPLRMLVLRHASNRGPAAARNAAVARARAPYLAFTDDDCLPTPGWLSALLPPLEDGAVVVQGRVTPPPQDWDRAGPWDHTIWVRRPSPFFETCNVGYDRARFEAVGGFDDEDPLLTPEEGRGFGEDAELAWRVLRDGGRRAYADAALVHHRCVPGDFRRWLRGQRQVLGFPGLARRSPIFARWLQAGVFLSARSAAFDAAAVAAAAAALSRRPWPLALALPYGYVRARDALTATRGDRARAVPVLVQLGVSDLVTLVSLVEGSVRHRRLVL